MDQYIGRYQFAPFIQIVISAEGVELFGQVTGFPKGQLQPTGMGEFKFEQVNASIRFTRDAKGIVNGLIMQRDGIQLPPARRLP